MEPTDDAVVAYLRAHAPGLPAAPLDGRAVTARARGALRRHLRIRNSVVAASGAVAGYLALALVGPVPVPGLGPVSVPGGQAVQGVVAGFVPGIPPGPDRWRADVERLRTLVLPVVTELGLTYYLLHEGPCRVLEYPRGNFRDGDQQECGELVPFDVTARADFDRVTRAVERCGVAVERIRRQGGGLYIQLVDYSWEYNWEYVYLPGVGSPPAATRPEERWTRIRGDWWFHRAHDD